MRHLQDGIGAQVVIIQVRAERPSATTLKAAWPLRTVTSG
jgi:hypothetical protein